MCICFFLYLITCDVLQFYVLQCIIHIYTIPVLQFQEPERNSFKKMIIAFFFTFPGDNRVTRQGLHDTSAAGCAPCDSRLPITAHSHHLIQGLQRKYTQISIIFSHPKIYVARMKVFLKKKQEFFLNLKKKNFNFWIFFLNFWIFFKILGAFLVKFLNLHKYAA